MPSWFKAIWVILFSGDKRVPDGYYTIKNTSLRIRQIKTYAFLFLEEWRSMEITPYVRTDKLWTHSINVNKPIT